MSYRTMQSSEAIAEGDVGLKQIAQMFGGELNFLYSLLTEFSTFS
jgi:hypothetical protein